MPFLTRHEIVDREVYIKLRQVHLVDIDRTSPDVTELYRLIQEHQKGTTEDEKVRIKAKITELNRTEAYTLPSQKFYLALTLPIFLVWAIAYIGIAAWRWVAVGFSQS